MCHAGVGNAMRALPLPGAARETKVHKTEQQKGGRCRDRLAEGFNSSTEYRFMLKYSLKPKQRNVPMLETHPRGLPGGSPGTRNHFWSHQSTWRDLKIHGHGVQAPSGHGLAVQLN